MKRILLSCNFYILLQCVFIQDVNAQHIEWVSTQPSTTIGVIENVLTCPDGGSVTAGEYRGTIDLDPGTGALLYISEGAYNNIFIKKMDTDGHLIWGGTLQSFGDSRVLGLCADTIGNIYMTGIFSDTLDFDPSTGVFIMSPPPGFYSVYVVKFDGTGGFIWARQIDPDPLAYGGIEVWDIKADDNNGVYISGNFYKMVDFDPGPDTLLISTDSLAQEDAFLLKLDQDGSFQWVNVTGGNKIDASFHLTIDDSNYVYVDGMFSDTVDFDPGPGTFNMVGWSGISGSRFLQKFNAAGQLIWAKTTLARGVGTGDYSLVVDHAGNTYHAGMFDTTYDFDPGPLIYNLAPESDTAFYIQKLDPDGNLVWVKQMSGHTFFSAFMMNVGSSNEIYLALQFTDTVDADPGMSYIPLVSSGNEDILVEKLSSSGELIWYGTINGAQHQYVNCIQYGTNGELYVGGYYYTPIDFKFGADSVSLPAGGYWGFLLKLDESPMGIQENVDNALNQICPNPTTDLVNLTLVPVFPAEVKVYDVQGNIVLEKMIYTEKTELKINGPEGLYFISVQQQSHRSVLKLLKQR